MSSLEEIQSCCLERFLSATTPQIDSPASLGSIISAFQESSVFGVLVESQRDKEYFIPSLSFLKLPGFSYNEVRPDYMRETLWQCVKAMNIEDFEIDDDSIMAVLWKSACKLPPGKLSGNILVYYNLKTLPGKRYLQVLGCMPFKIEKSWIHTSADQEDSSCIYWEQLLKNLISSAQHTHSLICSYHTDFSYISSYPFWL